MSRVLVCGGRDFRDWERLHSEMDALHLDRRFTHLIEGGCRTFDHKIQRLIGADWFAHEWAKSLAIPCQTFPVLGSKLSATNFGRC
jgi:hypothetical protein